MGRGPLSATQSVCPSAGRNRKVFPMISVMALIQTATDLRDSVVQDNEAAMRAGSGAGAGVLGSVFNRVVDRSTSFDYASGGFEADAVTQFFFPDISASMTAATVGGFNLSMGLPGPLVADLHSILCLQNTVIAPPIEGTWIKRMGLLRKRPEISSEEFQEQWFNLHALLVKRFPGVAGYRQNLVLDGPRDAEGNMMVDGLAEMWFPDMASIDTAFGSGAGETALAHAHEFIATVSTLVVEPTEFSSAR